MIEQVKFDAKPQEHVKKSEPALPIKAEHVKKSESAVPLKSEPVNNSQLAVPIKVEPGKKEGITTSVAPPKVDYATELFNLLCMDDSKGNDSKDGSANNTWVNLQCKLLLEIIL